jgi:hypothetical protein
LSLAELGWTTDTKELYIGNGISNTKIASFNFLSKTDVDDTPVDGETDVPVSSNWAYDHENGTDPHTQYLRNNTDDSTPGNLTANSFKSSQAYDPDAGALELTGGNGAIWLDSSKQKSITWNDGSGNFNIKTGSYYDSGEKYRVAGDGAAAMIMSSDGASGAISLKVVGTGTNAGDPVSYTDSLILSTTSLTHNGNDVLTDAVGIYGDGTDNGSVTIKTTDSDFQLNDPNNSGSTSYLYRDHSASKLYLGTPDDVVTFRSDALPQTTGAFDLGSTSYKFGSTWTNKLRTDHVDNIAGAQLLLTAGESRNHHTGLTGEKVYAVGEGGMEVHSSPDNWGALGWAGRYTATICDTSGNSSFPGDISCVNVEPTGNIYLGDLQYMFFGTGNDGRIWYHGTNNVVYYDNNTNEGRHIIRAKDTGGTTRTLALFDPDGFVSLYNGGTVKLNTTTTGIKVTGDIEATTNIEAVAVEVTGANALTVNGKDAEDLLVGKNYVMNGRFHVDQRNNNNTSTGSGHIQDRWALHDSSGTATTVNESGSLKLTTNSTYSSSAGYLGVEYSGIEGREYLEFFDKASVISFEIKTTNSITAWITLEGDKWDDVTYYMYTDTQTVANSTYTRIYFQIPANSSGTPSSGVDFGARFVIRFCETRSSEIGGSSDTWSTTLNLIDSSVSSPTSGTVINIRNVKWEVGDYPTPYESVTYAEDLARCQRFYQKGEFSLYEDTTADPARLSWIVGLPQTLRISPTIGTTITGSSATTRQLTAESGSLSHLRYHVADFTTSTTWWSNVIYTLDCEY